MTIPLHSGARCCSKKRGNSPKVTQLDWIPTRHVRLEPSAQNLRLHPLSGCASAEGGTWRGGMTSRTQRHFALNYQSACLTPATLVCYGARLREVVPSLSCPQDFMLEYTRQPPLCPRAWTDFWLPCPHTGLAPWDRLSDGPCSWGLVLKSPSPSP